MVYRIVIALYGLINILGGVFGFMKAKSPLSLIVGGLAGLILLYLAWLGGSKPGTAFRSAAGMCVALGGFWTYRLVKVQAEGKPAVMPAMNLALALGVFVILGAGHMIAMKNRKNQGLAH